MGHQRPQPRDRAQGRLVRVFREERRVGVYYFYICDPDFGPGFIKICTYFPYPAKVWVNGHEWAKRQADHAGIEYRALSNGFAACDQPAALQAICDSFAPVHVQWFFDRWITSIPTPFTRADRAAGSWWELSMRQVEVSRTLVLDDPRRARSFFEALVADNIGIGRPEQVALVLRPPAAPPNPPRLRHARVLNRHRRPHRLPLQAQPRQAVTSKTAARCGSKRSSTKPADLDVRARLQHLPD